jgi:hypothetical protein
MLAMQAMHQSECADNTVSFTVNSPEGKYTVGEATQILKAWLPGLKDTTRVPDDTRAQAPYERITAGEFAQYAVPSVEDGIDEQCPTDAYPV